MKKMLFIVALFLSFNLVLSANSKEEIFTKLKSEIKDAETLVAKFKFETGKSTQNIFIKAKKGNKYVLEMEERMIYCDGKNVWNYAPEQKNVMISKYESMKQEMSLENLFFNVIENSEPVALKSVNNSKNGKLFELELKANGKIYRKLANAKITLTLDSNNEIKAIEMENQGSSQTWEVIEIDLKRKLKDSEFTFTPSKSIEVIDLR